MPQRISTIFIATLFAIALAASDNSEAGEPSLAVGSLQPMSAVDFVSLPRIGGLSQSESGRLLSFHERSVDWKSNSRMTRLHIVDLESQDQSSQVAFPQPLEKVNESQWLNDDALLLVFKAEEDKHRQVYEYSISNQTLTRLTDHDSPVNDLIVASSNGFYFRARTALSAQIQSDLDDDWSIREYETRPFHGVWYFDLDRETSRLVLQGDTDIRDLSLSEDGRALLYARVPHTNADRPNSELWRYDIETNRETQLTQNAYAEKRPKLSPDGNHLLYIANVDAQGRNYYEGNVFLQAIPSNKPQLLLPDLDMEIQAADFAQDGSAIYILGNTGLVSHLYRYEIGTKALTQLTSGDATVVDWHYLPKLDRHVYRRLTASSLGDIWRLDQGSGEASKARQITHMYSQLGEQYLLPEQQAFVWQGPKGQDLEGILALPVPEQKFPVALVTITHGGPRSSSQFGSWNFSRAVSVLTGQGYAVFLPNHRGGSGYGDRFLRDMVGQYFRHAHLDVMTGIDALVDVGIADPNRLIKMGWSAGGHMTNKLITHTQRFVAASSGAGVSDWDTLFAESDVRMNRAPWFGGAPWDGSRAWKSYGRQSLLRQAYKITTPTLFFVGEKDVRVPPTQTIAMYRAAKAAGANVRFYQAPDQPHGFERPSYQLFKINTELAWYAKHTGKADYIPVYPDARTEHLSPAQPKPRIRVNQMSGNQAQQASRMERDSLGDKKVPKLAYYGVHTVRAVENMSVSGINIAAMPDLLRALAMVKKAAALTNKDTGAIKPRVAGAIVQACDEIISGLWFDQFVIDVYQGGAGTSTNMNANEVIANRANELLGIDKGDYQEIHPMAHVNCSQSTNDSYATAVRLCIYFSIARLCRSLDSLREAFQKKADQHIDVQKLARTQLQDAIPMTVGAELQAFAVTIAEDVLQAENIGKLLLEVNLGGTAVGSGLGASVQYAQSIIEQLRIVTGLPVARSRSLYEASWDMGAFVLCSGMTKRIAIKLSKICNDLRLLSSGPSGGLGEYVLPPCQAGSSIMPGKVNPVIPEMMNQVCFKVFGADTTVSFAAESGQLQLNAMEPIIVWTISEAIELLINGTDTLRIRCVEDLIVDEAHCATHLESSTALATFLVPHVGYERAADLAKQASSAKLPFRRYIELVHPDLARFLSQQI